MSRWTEPTRALPLRWGSYTGRYLAGLSLIVSGAVALQSATGYFQPALGLGALAHVVGWWVIPAAGWRRIWVVLPSLVGVIILLVGPAVVGLLAIPFACWLLVRHRPVLTFLLALVVLGTGVLLREVYAEYSGMLPALAIMAGVIVACAWLARLAASSRLFHRHRDVPTT
jgi:hypothetical protein